MRPEASDARVVASSPDDETQRLLSSLLPGAVACATLDPESAPVALHPAEEAYVRGAVAKRRREFAAGRACARAALARFGVRDAVLPPAPDRTPRWTDGFVGSITHCPGAAGAAVARTSDVESLGIDIEAAAPLPAELRTMIARETERRQLDRLASRADVDWFKLLFSAKESFFKCHFMVARRMLEFHDVEIAFDVDGGRFIGALAGSGEPRQLRGRFTVGSRHVFTAVVLERAR